MALSEADIAQLYERHGHALYRRCLRLVGNADDAHELLQETFCQFFQGRERFLGKSSPFTFLYRIATNLSIDRLRRRTTAGHQRTLDDGGMDDAPELTVAGKNQEQTTQAMQELAQLTEGLDEETLTIAVMSHVDELTQDEIAEILDLSRKTVGKKLQRFLELTQARAGLGKQGAAK